MNNTDGKEKVMKLEETLKEHLNEIMDAASDDLLITDGDGVVIRVSPSFEDRYGLPEDEALGKTVFELEEKGYFKPSIIAEVLRRGEKITMDQKLSSGRDIIATATPVFGDLGEIQFVVSFSRDITEMHSLQKRYSSLQNKVEKYEDEINKLRKANTETDIVSKSVQMDKVMALIAQVADYDTSVLLLGESGVGKTALARKIHQMSNRSHNAFVDINCAAIPENLLEAELFGYEKGSFTGADSKGKVGLIEMAQQGTLFLDEISEMPLALQAKLLKAIQEKKIQRIGGVKEIDVDFRLVTASNRNLAEAAEQGTFRKDLYYRLNVMNISIPPLRERKEDIAPLIYHFLDQFNERYGKNKSISKQAMDLLYSYEWPGNVRELSNFVERAYITSMGDVIHANELPDEVTGNTGIKEEDVGLDAAVELLEKRVITEAYRKYKTTIEVAKYLKISQPTASRKIKKYIKGE